MFSFFSYLYLQRKRYTLQYRFRCMGYHHSSLFSTPITFISCMKLSANFQSAFENAVTHHWIFQITMVFNFLTVVSTPWHGICHTVAFRLLTFFHFIDRTFCVLYVRFFFSNNVIFTIIFFFFYYYIMMIYDFYSSPIIFDINT